MWTAKLSAWGALAMGLVFTAVGAVLIGAGEFEGLALIPTGTGVVLLVGAYRTLRQMSGGLRLLAGAWGLAAGVLLSQRETSLVVTTHALAGAAYAFEFLLLASPYVALAGLALAVLHKEH